MPRRVSIFFFLITLASCRLVDEKPSPCFACSVTGKDSCEMTDNYAVFTPGRPDSTATIRFSRCGAGLLSTVRFNFSGNATGDSASITILIDSSATHTFPLSLPGGAKPLLQYQKGGFYELPLGDGIAFNQSCIVSFTLRTTRRDTLDNIFLHWAPKASLPEPQNDLHQKE
jgi:hypothetical protein